MKALHLVLPFLAAISNADAIGTADMGDRAASLSGCYIMPSQHGGQRLLLELKGDGRYLARMTTPPRHLVTRKRNVASGWRGACARTVR
jgi:hypothetical protein